MRRTLAVSLATLTLITACGADESTVDLPVDAAVAETATPSAPVTSDPTVSTAVETATPVSSDGGRLVDSMPEISGPTVLWFWAPG